MEQVVELFALACIEPSNYGRAISHWTEENWRMRWSSSASWYLPTSCGTTTSRGATQTTPDPLLVDPDEEFDAKVSDITQLLSAIERAKLGERTVYR